MIARIVLAALCSLPFAACGDDDPPYVKACARLCERAYECSSQVDRRQCANDCEASLDDVGPNLRVDYLNGIDACAVEQSCSVLGAAALLSRCSAESAARLAPTRAGEELCRRISDSLQSCIGLTVSSAVCLNGTKIFSDAALRRAAQCEQKSCDQRIPCLTSELGSNPTSAN